MRRSPTATAKVTPHGAFGVARDGGRRRHAGLDLAAAPGVELVAPEAGFIVLVVDEGKKGSGWHGYAPALVLLGESGVYHLLAHVEAGSQAAVDTKVTAGDVVARGGPLRHVHWEVRSKLKPNYAAREAPITIVMDPRRWLDGAGPRPFGDGPCSPGV